jgi:peptidoglycan/LPS O-acetylase OafA/YrhL
MVLLDKAGISFEWSFILALLSCFAVSYLMLLLVERPSQKIARALLIQTSKLYKNGVSL